MARRSLCTCQLVLLDVDRVVENGEETVTVEEDGVLTSKSIGGVQQAITGRKWTSMNRLQQDPPLLLWLLSLYGHVDPVNFCSCWLALMYIYDIDNLHGVNAVLIVWLLCFFVCCDVQLTYIYWYGTVDGHTHLLISSIIFIRQSNAHLNSSLFAVSWQKYIFT